MKSHRYTDSRDLASRNNDGYGLRMAQEISLKMHPREWNIFFWILSITAYLNTALNYNLISEDIQDVTPFHLGKRP